MVSLKTIAEKCGVSTATVSKALNDQKDISEETKSRIRTVAEQLGYFPNAEEDHLRPTIHTTSEFYLKRKQEVVYSMNIFQEY